MNGEVNGSVIYYEELEAPVERLQPGMPIYRHGTYLTVTGVSRNEASREVVVTARTRRGKKRRLTIAYGEMVEVGFTYQYGLCYTGSRGTRVVAPIHTRHGEGGRHIARQLAALSIYSTRNGEVVARPVIPEEASKYGATPIGEWEPIA